VVKAALAAAAAVALLGGCQIVFGIEDTTLEPDAPADASPDASPDAPPDAPPPPVDMGTGADGDLMVGATTYTDDVRTPLTATVGGLTVLNVGAVEGFGIGDELVVMQMTGALAGQYQTRRVSGTSPGQITIDAPLSLTFTVSASAVAQVIRVRNFEDITIPAGGLMTAHPWDGATGGVVFFRAHSLTVAAAGAVRVDAAGFDGAAGGAGGEGGVGVMGGGGATTRDCPILNCNSATNAGTGGNGEAVDALNGAIGGPPGVNSQCRGGYGGRGGLLGGLPPTATPAPGEAAAGPGGGAAGGAGGSNAGDTVERPMLGGGGGGGAGGLGGAGGSGGGGGGGGVSGSNGTAADGVAGGPGGDGGTGGIGGRGGSGGGVVIIFAGEIDLDGSGVPHGTISASGGGGDIGAIGATGGQGGTGGFGGGGAPCHSGNVFGGRGGGGQGAVGGAGGDGGGGAGGGTVLISAYDLRLGGDVRALGGAGGMPGAGGMGGPGGVGYSNGPVGPDGVVGTSGGQPGSNGLIYLRYVDTCEGCKSAAEPAAMVIDL
jgi:hypothetical protein